MLVSESADGAPEAVFEILAQRTQCSGLGIGAQYVSYECDDVVAVCAGVGSKTSAGRFADEACFGIEHDVDVDPFVFWGFENAAEV